MKLPCYRNKNIGLLILRIVVGGLFLIHGIQKLQDMEGTIGFFSQIGLNGFWAWVAALVETVGGAFLVLGLFVEYAALLLSVVMVVAMITVKFKFGGETLSSKFMASQIDISLLGSCLALVFSGAGRYSLSKLCKCHFF